MDWIFRSAKALGIVAVGSLLRVDVERLQKSLFAFLLFRFLSQVINRRRFSLVRLIDNLGVLQALVDPLESLVPLPLDHVFLVVFRNRFSNALIREITLVHLVLVDPRGSNAWATHNTARHLVDLNKLFSGGGLALLPFLASCG